MCIFKGVEESERILQSQIVILLLKWQNTMGAIFEFQLLAEHYRKNKIEHWGYWRV